MTNGDRVPLVWLYGMKRKIFLPMWNSPSQKMTTSATLGLGKNYLHTSNDVDDKFIYDDQVRIQNFKLEGVEY